MRTKSLLTESALLRNGDGNTLDDTSNKVFGGRGLGLG